MGVHKGVHKGYTRGYTRGYVHTGVHKGVHKVIENGGRALHGLGGPGAAFSMICSHLGL